MILVWNSSSQMPPSTECEIFSLVYIPRQVVTSAKDRDSLQRRIMFYPYIFLVPISTHKFGLAFLGLFRKDCKTIAFQYKRSCRRRRKNPPGDWRASIRSGTPKVIGYLLKFQMERQSLQLIVVLDSVHRWPPIFCESFFSAFPAA